MNWGRGFRSALLGQSTEPVNYVCNLLQCVAEFDELRIGYCLVGEIAAMFYGRPRFAEVIEFLTTSEFSSPRAETELLKDEHAAGIVGRARDAELEGGTIQIADPHDLIAMKLRVGWILDDYDISEVIKANPIDESILEKHVSPRQFAHFLEIKRRN
jgi:hypothetical protein